MNKTLKAADGANVPGVVVNLFAGPSGLTSGQFGRFASIVSEARDPNGTGFVRRLELTQESFAKYAYWSNNENNASGGTIVFGNGDALWGPVWSNDTITIDNTGATFHDDVGTAAPVIVNPSHGTFFKGYQVKQHPISLPSLTTLSTMNALATVSNYNITLAPAYTGAESRRAVAHRVRRDGSQHRRRFDGRQRRLLPRLHGDVRQLRLASWRLAGLTHRRAELRRLAHDHRERC